MKLAGIPINPDLKKRGEDPKSSPLLWETIDGDKLVISDMGTEHIKNALEMLKRAGYFSDEDEENYLTCDQPRGDMAQVAFEAEFEHITNNVSPFISIFERELEERGIKR